MYWKINLKATKLLVILCIIIILSVGCQATPAQDEVAIKQKDFDEFLDMATETTGADGQNSNITNTKYQAPKTLKETLTLMEGKLKVTIDAKVVIPEASNYSILEIVPDQITFDQFKQIESLFFEDVEYFQGGRSRPITKEELEQQILILSRLINDPNSKYSQLDGKERDQAITSAKEKLQQLKEQYQDAPEKKDLKPLDATEQLLNQKDYYLSADIISKEPSVLKGRIMAKTTSYDKKMNAIKLQIFHRDPDDKSYYVETEVSGETEMLPPSVTIPESEAIFIC